MEVVHWSSGRTGGYFLNYFVMNAGKVARKLAEIALTKVVKVGENKLTMYNIILSAIVVHLLLNLANALFIVCAVYDDLTIMHDV